MRCDMVVNLKWGWQAYTSKTVRDISTFTVLFSVSWPFLIFLFQTCLWRVIYAVLLGHGWFSCLIRTMLPLFTDKTFIINFIFARFLFEEIAVVLIRERTLWFAGRYLATSRVGFRTPAEGETTFGGDLVFVCRFCKIKFSLTQFLLPRFSPIFFFTCCSLQYALTNWTPDQSLVVQIYV